MITKKLHGLRYIKKNVALAAKLWEERNTGGLQAQLGLLASSIDSAIELQNLHEDGDKERTRVKMGNTKYKYLKVFDCQDMPDQLGRDLRQLTEKGNDVVVEWCVHSVKIPDPIPEESRFNYETHMAVDAWLIEHGALPAPSEDYEGERVLIKHWW